jgi:hypothetical protein
MAFCIHGDFSKSETKLLESLMFDIDSARRRTKAVLANFNGSAKFAEYRGSFRRSNGQLFGNRLRL